MCFFLMKWNSIVLFFRRKRKELKESITLPRPPLKGRMQPLLHVALSLRYARTIKGPACFFCCDYAWLVAFFLSGDRSLTAPMSGDWWESVDIEQKKVWEFEKDVVTLQR